jgi:asparagine synthase (glutamine-hydrolysing)
MSGDPTGDSRTDLAPTGAAEPGIAGIYGAEPAAARPIAAAQAHRQASQRADDDEVAVVLDGARTNQKAAEQLLASFKELGTAAFGQLPGHWAAAVTDHRDGRVHLAVDAAGAGALYYAAEVRAYASEPTALLAAPGVTAAPDDETVRRYLLTGASDQGERTFFAGITRVPAGHVTTLDADKTTTVAYEQPEPAAADLVEAVDAVLAADRTAGVLLHPGAPAAFLAARLADAQVHVLSAGPTSGADTGQAAATALGRTPNTVPASGDQLGTDLAEFVRLLGEPVPDLSVYGLYAAAKATSGTTVVDSAGAENTLDLPVETAKAKRTVDVKTLLSTVDDVTAEPADTIQAALRVADRIGAHTGVEISLPFCAPEVRRAAGPGAGEKVAALLTPRVRAAAGTLRPAAPVTEWLLRLKNRVYGTFLSESFTTRPWFAQQEILVAFEDFIKGRNADAAIFWRLLNVELWMAEFVDPKPDELPVAAVKGPLEANNGKKLAIDVDGEQWLRFPVRTDLFARGDDFEKLISGYVRDFFDAVESDGGYAERFEQPWYLLVSEKVIAISQGRSYFIWDIQPNWWARTLAKFVVKTPYGIGLGSPWTMQLAIQEAGLPRILVASAAGAAGKVIGRRGLFYQVAGHSVRAIDGPTEYSAYPSNVSAKLAPAKPKQVATGLLAALRAKLADSGRQDVADKLAGVVVIDANDIGRNILGASADRPDMFFEKLFADNPLGQGSEQTPLAVAVRAGEV